MKVSRSQRFESKRAKEFLEEKKRKNSIQDKSCVGIPVKTISEINDKLLGLRGLMLIAAAPNTGKTALTIQLGLEAVEKNEDICLLYISIDQENTNLKTNVKNTCMYICSNFASEYNNFLDERFYEIKNHFDDNHDMIDFATTKNASITDFKDKLFQDIICRIEVVDYNDIDIINSEAICQQIEELKLKTGTKRALVIVDYVDNDKNCKAIHIKKIVDGLDEKKEALVLISEKRKIFEELIELSETTRISLLNLYKMTPEAIEKLTNNGIDGEKFLKGKEEEGISICSFDVVKGRDGMQKFQKPLMFSTYSPTILCNQIEKYQSLKDHDISPIEISNFIIKNSIVENMSHCRLQNLLYYAQAWYLADHNKSLFEEDFKAWIHGPVLPSQYHRFESMCPIYTNNLPYKRLRHIQNSTLFFHKKIEKYLISFIRIFSGVYDEALSNMAISEEPWKNARKEIPEGLRFEHSNRIIPKEEMKRFYKSL